ncbi:MAG: bifunctional phosphopantothenoylcysteine decarboxylase/phosphopantothenate--cysteine ligase CoaBC [Candidatus Thermoplasmatota archaeon]|nr:bifunctional phosphopantothenoylcysteine decarboxylase/phosphopantothenate--cysteine ligase CoaBC [Candidatus Thermoplasmatota archaeon]MBU1940180.1 bifunctional phosphopantothenoylcysteine decarboxylase/phosphopantothenate--cysteine ligase CoaBC [Candidatus Thermoplasmatota archaeon]
MHPACELRGTSSSKLKKKRIALAVTGSIAAVNTIQLARELIRHGADVIPLMTPNATKIIHPNALEFATSHKPIITLTGQTEHVTYCGMIQEPIDLLIISPCTANTLSKIIHGIDDTTVTTFATTAIGSKIPILLIPAMHQSMYQHPIIQTNIQHCKKIGIHVIPPNIVEHKAKMPNTPHILTEVYRILSKHDLTHENILIIGGTTAEPIDDIRIITSKSSGKTASTIATTAYERGASVTLWYGNSPTTIPDYIPTTRYHTFQDLKTLIEKTKLTSYTTIIVCAAIADYHPQPVPGKIKSGQPTLTLHLKPNQKLLPLLRKNAPKAKLIAFKLEANKNTLEKATQNLLKNNNLQMVIGNTIAGIGSTDNTICIYHASRKYSQHTGKKSDLAQIILDNLKE